MLIKVNDHSSTAGKTMLSWCHNGDNRKYFVSFVLEQLCHTDRLCMVTLMISINFETD